ncbi:Panacea domain-containing protein [Mesorhizobium sp.]|uniref:Panacea domain-containing protein n=1 Tax=Mesorhizobium sp. TaxID=1871066 RepID=UPI000FE942D0|nr:type II toxin-antitoxin system antitoxin SocA domain-containing protein [Mesorhizobium sp.]RWD79743.1 MAG: DUF4065 domain-containing protein [Mesorhizobium sp.]
MAIKEQILTLAPTAVATWFINRIDRAAGEAITHLKVQKLVYYADAWFLANYDRSLISDDFEAWAHGPVVRSVYEKYRDCGYIALEPEKPRAIHAEVLPVLEAVHREYGQFSAKRLEGLTHHEDPWKLTRGDLAPEAKCTRSIDKLLMRNFYAAKIGKKEIKTLQN